MWWESEEEGYRVTITPNTDDNVIRQLYESGGGVGTQGRNTDRN